MKVTMYGITVSLIREEDIEMVRRWRNDPVVAGNYEFREHISPEMQQVWFKSIYNRNNLYTVIEYQGRKRGVINLKDIDWEKKTFDGGIFLPDPMDHDTPLPAIVSYMTTKIMFGLFGWPVGYVHVLRENRHIQTFVKQLGYELCPGQEEANNQQYCITRERFEQNSAKIAKAVSVLAGGSGQGKFVVETRDFNDEVVLFWEKVFLNFKKEAVAEVTGEGRVYYFD